MILPIKKDPDYDDTDDYREEFEQWVMTQTSTLFYL